MKTNYLNELKKLLDQYQMEDTEKNEIISDYNEMYDNWVAYGMTDKDVEEKLGSPDSIIGELTEGIKKVSKHLQDKKARNSGKIIAVTPFIALVIFFVGGFVYEGWAYSWMAFLIIPITAIISEMSLKKDPHVFTALSPFAAVIGYLVLGFYFALWHPGWVIFLIIPIVAIFTERKSIGFLNTLVSLSPFAAVIAYLMLGENGYWVEGWVVFLIIPALGVLNEKNVLKIIVWELVIIGGTLGYLYIGDVSGNYLYGSLAFIPLVVFSVLQDENGFRTAPRDYKIIVLLAIIIYVILGFTLDLWGYAWLVFFIIPVYAIKKEARSSDKVIAYTPFIATTIFFSLGWFFNLWAIAWLAFLIIPIVAIIKEG